VVLFLLLEWPELPRPQRHLNTSNSTIQSDSLHYTSINTAACSRYRVKFAAATHSDSLSSPVYAQPRDLTGVYVSVTENDGLETSYILVDNITEQTMSTDITGSTSDSGSFENEPHKLRRQQRLASIQEEEGDRQVNVQPDNTETNTRTYQKLNCGTMDYTTLYMCNRIHDV